MLIFHRFESVHVARNFMIRVLPAASRLYMSQEESNKVDPFPYVLTPPIVLVERRYPIDMVWEDNITNMAIDNFAGT